MPSRSSSERRIERWLTNWLNTNALCRLATSSMTVSMNVPSFELRISVSGASRSGLQQAWRSLVI